MITYYPDASSRYKDTPLVRTAQSPGAEVDITYDLFESPVEFVELTLGNYSMYTVTREDVGFPDRIAYLVWGAGMEANGWVIALVNGIMDAETDLFPGQRLFVPSYNLLQQFLGRSPSSLEIQGQNILTFSSGASINAVV